MRALRPDGVEVAADFVRGNLEATLAVVAEPGRHAPIADSDVEEHGGEWMWVTPVHEAECSRTVDRPCGSTTLALAWPSSDGYGQLLLLQQYGQPAAADRRRG